MHLAKSLACIMLRKTFLTLKEIKYVQIFYFSTSMASFFTVILEFMWNLLWYDTRYHMYVLGVS